MSEAEKIKEIAESGGDDLESENSENDDDVPNDYEEDDFLVGDGEEEDSYEEKPQSRKRGRRRHGGGRPKKKSRKLKKLKSKMSRDEIDYQDQDNVERGLGRGEDYYGENIGYGGMGDESLEFDEENEYGEGRGMGGEFGVRGGRRDDIEDAEGGALDGFIEDDMHGDYGDDEEDDYEYDMEDIYSEPASLRQHYEPDVLQEKFFTEFDDQVRATDVPERLQVELEDVAEVDVDAVDCSEEAQWVVSQEEINETQPGVIGGWDDTPESEETGLKSSVQNVLEMITQERMDLPSIFHYRRDSIPAIQSFQSLATILDLHHRYLQLIKRKHTLIQSLNQLQVPTLYHNLLQEAQSFEELDDFSAFVSHRQDAVDASSNTSGNDGHGDDTGVTERTKPRRRTVKGPYRRAMAAGLGGLAQKIGLSSQQYADNLISMFRRVSTDDPAESPDILAEDFFRKPFDSTSKVIQGASQILAKDIAMEPAVRRKLRVAYQNSSLVVITAGPQAGPQEQESGGRLGGIELQPDGVPISDMESTTVMSAVQAERRGLVQIQVTLDENVTSQALDADALFLSERVSAVAKEWNAVRKSVIEQAAKELQPVMQKHILQSLLGKARRSLAQQCASSLRDIAFAGPFVPGADQGNDDTLTEGDGMNNNNDNNDDDGGGFGGLGMGDDGWGDIGGGDADHHSNHNHGTSDNHHNGNNRETSLKKKVGSGYRVIGASEATDGRGVFFAAINENGDLDERLEWRVLPTGPRHQTPTPQVQEQNHALKELITTFEPHAIALAALSVGTRRLFQELEKAVESCRQEQQRTGGTSLEHLQVHWVPDNVSRIYAMSNRGQNELPQVNPGMRMALGVGRRLQHPLAETAGLFNSQQDVLNLQLHPLQGMLPSSHLQRTLEWEMVDMVCAVGVDINHVVNHQHAMGMLQFVSGLGPRKAAQMRSLITGIGSQGHVRSRVELGKLLNSPRIADNCLGFIRVVSSQDDHDSMAFDPLDNTRIHPKHYPVAETICKELAPSAPRDEHVEEVLLRGHNQDLDQVDLDALAGMLTEEGVGRQVLQGIAQELRQPFQDPRPLFQDPDADTLWTMLTGETDSTLHTGKLVEVTVIRANDRQVLVRLPCGVMGSIMPSQMPSWVTDPQEMAPGSMLEAVVQEIDKPGFFVRLTAGDFEVDAARPTPTPTPTTTALSTDGIGTGRKPVPSTQQKRRHAKKQRYRRNVNHPLFSNVDYAGAVRKLQDSQVGEAVIRPSSKGPDHLAITFKFFGDCFMTIDVKEHDKSNPLALGRILEVDGHKFHELDEVCVRYVDAKVQNAEKVMRSDKYMEGSSEDVEAHLKDLKRREPGRIHYRIGLYHNHPGLFMIYYISSSRVHHEVFSVVPEGYRYHSKNYSSVMSLINAFKRYIQSGRPHHRSRSRSTAHNNNNNDNNVNQNQPSAGGNTFSTSTSLQPQENNVWGSMGSSNGFGAVGGGSEWEDPTTSTGPGWENLGGGNGGWDGNDGGFGGMSSSGGGGGGGWC
eukprot:gb/GECH01013869.1/.p1 GENE.gb/GECH01013869.1/~~gb/GECH01013869.1/.p1  ORF type:complete len:1508 (+),score=339.15 gb/GECH01013869.1/:1-4524(+)